MCESHDNRHNCSENELFGVSLDNIQEYRLESNKESPPSKSERR